jgi:Mg-chelatase subunit ChlD
MKKKRSLLLVAFSLLVAASCLAAEPLEVLTPALKGKLDFQVIDEKSLLVSVKDVNNTPVRGLKTQDFVLQSGTKMARILSVEPLESSKSVPLNIVLVVDNSASMQKRQAIKPLMAAIDEFFMTLRPIDNVTVVVFDKKGTMQVKGYNLNIKTYHSKLIPELKAFLEEAFDEGLTSQTFLYEAIEAGVSIIRKMPKEDTKFLVILSDGEDINSDFEFDFVESEAKGIENLEVFSVDYMPGNKVNKFLKSFAEGHGGRVWKATSASELLPIFKSFSTTMLYRYVVTYRFPDPPKGTLNLQPAALNFDMLTLLDGSPVLNKVFFETGQSEIPDSYVLLKSRAHTAAFNENVLASSLDRYKNVLNIVGRHLTAIFPEPEPKPLKIICRRSGKLTARAWRSRLAIYRPTLHPQIWWGAGRKISAWKSFMIPVTCKRWPPTSLSLKAAT